MLSEIVFKITRWWDMDGTVLSLLEMSDWFVRVYYMVVMKVHRKTMM
jgi:hypothetical protein